MAERDHDDGPSLFDLPLSSEEARRPPRTEGPRVEGPRSRTAARGSVARGGDPQELPLFGAAADAQAVAQDDDDGWPLAGDARPVPQEVLREVPREVPRSPAPPTATAPLAHAAADWQDLEASAPELPESVAADEPARPVTAPVLHRLSAALLDGGLLLVATAGAIVGSYSLGVRWDTGALPPLAAFLALFSFVYTVVPLAFWGRTAGMALARILARGADGGPLTFGQTALRWFGGVLTVALVGLPLLLALPSLGGRSLADRVSGSRTWLLPDA